MLDSRNCKRLLLNSWKVLEEGGNKVFSLVQANGVHKGVLLVVFLLQKTAYVAKLN
jgi:hypothetical protein